MFIVAPFISSTGLVVVAEEILRCGGFLSEKSCRHSAGSFSFFLVLTTRHYLSFHKFERHSCLFGLIVHFSLVKRTWECLVFSFSFFCGIVSFYVPISDAVFLVTTFPFLIRVSGWYYLFDALIFISFIQFYWSSGRCTSEFALECFCLKKVITNW